MIWIDFGVICIGQTEKAFPHELEDLQFDACNRSDNSESIYGEHYDFRSADALSGYWYNIWLPETLCYNDSFFDISHRNVPWVKVVPKWENTVKRILEFYIKESPEHRIAVLLRIEDKSENCVHLPCCIDYFMNALRCGCVRWN